MLRAELRGALGRNIANGRPFGSPILGTQEPNGIVHTGWFRIGKLPVEFLKYLQIPEKVNILSGYLAISCLIASTHKCHSSYRYKTNLHFNIPERDARCNSCGNDPSDDDE
jgi:hypothetical protein